jgi:hypothetical protein
VSTKDIEAERRTKGRIMNSSDYITAQDTAVSQDLYADAFYTDRKLAYALADEISLRSDNSERVVMLSEFNGPLSGWDRWTICRALAARGVTVQVLNRRCS